MCEEGRLRIRGDGQKIKQNILSCTTMLKISNTQLHWQIATSKILCLLHAIRKQKRKGEGRSQAVKNYSFLCPLFLLASTVHHPSLVREKTEDKLKFKNVSLPQRSNPLLHPSSPCTLSSFLPFICFIPSLSDQQ